MNKMHCSIECESKAALLSYLICDHFNFRRCFLAQILIHTKVHLHHHQQWHKEGCYSDCIPTTHPTMVCVQLCTTGTATAATDIWHANLPRSTVSISVSVSGTAGASNTTTATINVPLLQQHDVTTLPSPSQSHIPVAPLTPQHVQKHVTFTHGHSQVGLPTPQHSVTHETTPTGVGTLCTNVTPKPVDNPEKTENVENIMVTEEPLAEPLGPSSDDENCVYFKISKSDMNKPDFAKFLSEAIQQKASGDKADTKSDTKIVMEDEKSKMDVTETQ